MMVFHIVYSKSDDIEALQFRYSSSRSEDGTVLQSSYVLKQQEGENTRSWYCLAKIVLLTLSYPLFK